MLELVSPPLQVWSRRYVTWAELGEFIKKLPQLTVTLCLFLANSPASLMGLRNEHFHNENIENLIPKPPEPLPPKQIRFQSKYHSQVVEESTAGKASHLTMGEAESYLAPPDRYLRKHTGTGGNHVRAKSARTHSKSQH